MDVEHTSIPNERHCLRRSHRHRRACYHLVARRVVAANLACGLATVRGDVGSGIAELIKHADTGNSDATRQLFTVLYDELHRLASHQVSRAGGLFSLGTTTLLHEAYLDIADREGTHFPDRARFMAYASRAMRGLVIDHIRRARAAKRGGGTDAITLSDDTPQGGAYELDAPQLDRLSSGLDALAALEPALAQLVDLHFFCGFSHLEIAKMRGVSERTVQRDWRKARVFLFREMTDSSGAEVEAT